MKVINILSALAVVAADGCEKDGDFKCEKEGEVCLYRYTLDVANPKDKDYKSLLKSDAEAKKGGELYSCKVKSEAETLLESSKKKDAKTTVTF